ncbi:hypothetical protein TNCV_3499571 [Trichonephila clavipes]|nr:hypothetical protein TNCV_3499571 [Trichonephila clavipes]
MIDPWRCEANLCSFRIAVNWKDCYRLGIVWCEGSQISPYGPFTQSVVIIIIGPIRTGFVYSSLLRIHSVLSLIVDDDLSGVRLILFIDQKVPKKRDLYPKGRIMVWAGLKINDSIPLYVFGTETMTSQ